jgi:hypothetical protein
MTVTTGSIWTGGFGVFFKVTAVARTGDETWIVYTKIGDPKSSYSCLEPAFLQRFHQHINGSY